MNELLSKINELRKSELRELINNRLLEFKNNNELFSELCFCILTANFNAERVIIIQKKIGKGFLTLSKKSLVNKLKKFGHRFPNTRAEYIIYARKHKDKLIMNREWLIKNIKGIGYKEASHFLRNTGHNDFAIIDFHVIDLLVKYGLIDRPKTLTKKKYLEIESLLKEMGNKLNMKLGELDLYLWYLETGRVLK